MLVCPVQPLFNCDLRSATCANSIARRHRRRTRDVAIVPNQQAAVGGQDASGQQDGNLGQAVERDEAGPTAGPDDEFP